jgi:hypothetical protein
VNESAQRFALNDEQYAALEADSRTELPKIMGRVYVEAVGSALKMVQQFVPQMIAKASTELRQSQEAEQEFFQAWPGLSREKHGATIRQFAYALAQGNPNLSRKQLIDAVGAAVSQYYNVSRQPMAAPPGAGLQSQAPKSFVPAAKSAPIVHQQRRTPEENPFMMLGQEFEE